MLCNYFTIVKYYVKSGQKSANLRLEILNFLILIIFMLPVQRLENQTPKKTSGSISWRFWKNSALRLGNSGAD